ncbi:hypothetical protein M2404_003126 [Rheinheimera pacifica]|uniref:TonB-dependent receptor plug domain-containing protein n=1 Tax=Rheinheimera pacifica TaxID=173990 RepID=UPI0021682995|nr:TonB-dependent receptor plug domain-containing protein [Rheinheimera pacifica]MCS4308764.1 hypothetical protein [Rheinheimera pacifica]
MRLTAFPVYLLASFNLFALQAEETQSEPSAKLNNITQCIRGKTAEGKPCTDENVEYIHVRGRYIGPEVPEIQGRYHLNREFIDRVPKTSGDINEIIALMPGVQLSESALSAAESQEIRAKELSISGGQPWQTGFFLDGVNFNNRIDPGSYSGGLTSANDVRGGPQAFTINSQIVESIDVYDSNVPAEYGDFSGGVVAVKSRSATDFIDNTFGFSYRTTRSDWGNYHIINGDLDTNIASRVPLFEKNSYSAQGVYKINSQHAIMVNANYLESLISDVSLSQLVETKRTSTNLLVKYSMRDVLLDQLDFTVTYAPYEDHNLLKNVKDSNMIVDGGGLSSSINFREGLSFAELSGKLGFTRSENSRQAPEHYYIWLQSKGKDWGSLDPSNTGATTLVSKEGGHGNLEKTQTNISFDSDLNFDTVKWLGLEHQLKAGMNLNLERMQRIRDKDSYNYNAVRQHSSNINPLNCNGYTLDCVELSFFRPLSELEAELGEPLNFLNPVHVALYGANVASTPQYFESRIVYPEENIDEQLFKGALYLTDQLAIGKLTLNLGLRYNTDNFFKNHNIAPRISGGYDVFGDSDTLLTFGANRYYDAGLLTYKIREVQTPYRTEYRPIRSGALQGWLESSADSDVRYRYVNVKTPYNDEITLGVKQATDLFGTFSVKWVKRWKKDQLAAAADPILEDGYRYSYQDNSGSGYSKRLSLSWSIKLGQHSLWANTSFSKNYSNNNDYEDNPDNVPVDELVIYEGMLTTKASLNRVNTNFGRPTIVNFGWTADWLDNLDTSLSGTFTESYETALHTGNYASSGEISRLCPECESSSVLVPVYRRVSLASRTMYNLAVRYHVQSELLGNFKITADISNLFDSRTYLISSGSSGIETGRQFWLGISYDLN